MYSAPSNPRSIGGVLDDIVRLFRSSFVYCLPAALILAVAGFGVSTYFGEEFAPGTQPAVVQAHMMALVRSPATWGAYAGFLLVSTWLYCAMIWSVLEVAAGRQPRLVDGFAAGMRALPTAVIGIIAFTLALVGGTILLLIPGIYLWGRMQYWIVAMMANGSGPFESFGVSWRLVKGHWWRCFAIFFVLVVVCVALLFVLGVLSGILTAFLSHDLAMRLIVTRGVSAISNLFMVPLISVALVAIYQDLQLRSEGGDLEARIGAMPAT